MTASTERYDRILGAYATTFGCRGRDVAWNVAYRAARLVEAALDDAAAAALTSPEQRVD